jgi:hypothetical protein
MQNRATKKSVNDKIPIEEYRELDSFSKWHKKLEENGIYLDDELSTNFIITLSRHMHKKQIMKFMSLENYDSISE